jgi:peroxiredoxin
MGFWNSILSTSWAFLLMSLGASSAACSNPVRSVETPRRNDRLPDVRLLGDHRRPTTLAELSRGRPALISLWATWCDSCADVFGALNRLHQRVGETALVVGIAQGEDYAHVTDFVNRKGIAYPQLVDEQFAFSDAAGAKSLPAVLVTDRQGSVRHCGGKLDSAALRALRDALAASAR